MKSITSFITWLLGLTGTYYLVSYITNDPVLGLVAFYFGIAFYFIHELMRPYNDNKGLLGFFDE